MILRGFWRRLRSRWFAIQEMAKADPGVKKWIERYRNEKSGKLREIYHKVDLRDVDQHYAIQLILMRRGSWTYSKVSETGENK